MKLLPRDHRLFHHTSCLDYVRDILTHGFWPRYCVEDFTWLVGDPAFMAFPVVCFCDIPIAAASSHRARYRPYALAMSKIWALPRDINPVWYIHAASSIYFHFGKIVQDPVCVTLSSIPASIKPLLPFLKLTVGTQPERQHALRPGSLEVLAFEDELEWRHTPRTLADTWKFGRDRDIVSQADHDLSKSQRLLVDCQDIDSVYVCTVAERKELSIKGSVLENGYKRYSASLLKPYAP